MLRKTLAGFAAISLALAGAPAPAQNYSPGYQFLKAVKDRDGTKTETLLVGAGQSLVNAKDVTSGDAAVHILTRDRDLTWLNYVLDKGARPDIQNDHGDTAMVLATQLGWQDGVIALLRAGAKVDAANSKGETPLILAVHKRDIPMIRLLLANGADPKKTDRIAGYSAMDYAKQDSRDAPLVRILQEDAKPAKKVAGPGL